MKSLQGYALSPAQIVDIVMGVSGTYRLGARYQLLDRDLNPVASGATGNDPADISRWVYDAKITNQLDRSTHRSMDITMLRPDSVDFNATRHLIKAYVDFFDANDNVILEVPVGIFWFILPDRDIDDAQTVWTMTGNDLSGKLARIKFLNTYTIPAGTPVTQAATIMLQQDYLPASQGGRGPGTSNIASPTGAGVSLVYVTAGTGAYYANALGTNIIIGYQNLWGGGLASTVVAQPGDIAVTTAPSTNGFYVTLGQGARFQAGQVVLLGSYGHATVLSVTPSVGTTSPADFILVDSGLTDTPPPGTSVAGPPYETALLSSVTQGVTVSGLVVDRLNLVANTVIAHAAGEPVAFQVLWPDANNPGITPAGLDNAGPNIPASRIKVTPSPLVLPAPKTFLRTQDLQTAINELMTAINYYDLEVDSFGDFSIKPKEYYDLQIPQAEWAYVTDETSVVLGPVTQRFQGQVDAANIVTVECNNNQYPSLYSIQYNKSDLSMISLTIMREAVVANISDDTIPDQETIDLRAYVELQERATLSDQIAFSIPVNPFFEHADFLSVTITDDRGATVIQTTDAQPYRTIAWELDMTTMEMKLTMGRVIPI